MLNKIYPNPIGLHITLNTGISLTDATGLTFDVIGPDDVSFSLDATQVGSTDALEYFTVDNDFPDPGKYRIQTRVKRSGFDIPGNTYTLTITPLGQ